jgi:hypothetical protein
MLVSRHSRKQMKKTCWGLGMGKCDVWYDGGWLTRHGEDVLRHLERTIGSAKRAGAIAVQTSECQEGGQEVKGDGRSNPEPSDWTGYLHLH